MIWTGILASKPSRLDHCTDNTWLADVRSNDNGLTKAHIKLLPDDELESELVCACLARLLKLPTPLPGIVRINRSDLPDEPWPDDTISRLAFGRIDERRKSFAQTIGSNNPNDFIPSLMSWPKLQETCSFDEWIDNSGRSFENLLYEDHSFWLIDHAHALKTDRPPAATTNNTLLRLAFNHLSRQQLPFWINGANVCSRKHQEIDLDNVNCGESEITPNIWTWLAARIPYVVANVRGRLGQTQLI